MNITEITTQISPNGGFKPVQFVITLLIVFSVFGSCYLCHFIESWRCRKGRVLDAPKRVLKHDPDSILEQRVGPCAFYHLDRPLPTATGSWLRDTWLRRKTTRTRAPQSSIDFIDKFLKGRYGTTEGHVPLVKVPEGVDLLAVSIPAKNFRCGSESAHFEPRDNRRGLWSYQMLSRGVQKTQFTAGGKCHVAGVTIYPGHLSNFEGIDRSALRKAFHSPDVYIPQKSTQKSVQRRWCQWRREWVIVVRNEYDEIRKFEYDGKSERLTRIECSNCCCDPLPIAPVGPPTISSIPTPSKPVPECISWLKVEFCSMEKQPVMIGKNVEGNIVHYDWNLATRKFEARTCQSCGSVGGKRFETEPGAEDEPPSYKYLELIEKIDIISRD